MSSMNVMIRGEADDDIQALKVNLLNVAADVIADFEE